MVGLYYSANILAGRASCPVRVTPLYNRWAARQDFLALVVKI